MTPVKRYFCLFIRCVDFSDNKDGPELEHDVAAILYYFACNIFLFFISLFFCVVVQTARIYQSPSL